MRHNDYDLYVTEAQRCEYDRAHDAEESRRLEAANRRYAKRISKRRKELLKELCSEDGVY